MPVTRDGMLHFKHAALGYASADLGDLMADQLLLRARTGEGEYSYPDVDALLQAVRTTQRFFGVVAVSA